MEDAIASLLAGLRGAEPEAESSDSLTPPSTFANDSPSVAQAPSHSDRPRPGPSKHLGTITWHGGTLAINAGATTTEMALVELPKSLQDLASGDFRLRSFPYAGNSIDQDIVCQLLYPQWARRQRSQKSEFPAVPEFLPSSWHEIAAQVDAAEMTWEHLGLEQLELPRPGEPDLPVRYRLQQQLEDSFFGQVVLEVAKQLKLILQYQDCLTLELGDQQWVLLRRELESQVFVPFIQQLNRQLNALLNQQTMPVQAIKQVICTGGTTSLPAIARWLQQKLPNATIVQDLYQEGNSPVCSRVAHGLATLPLYPQVLDLPRQQYSDYFLLLELLRIFPDRSLSHSEVMQLLERRGINTHSCQERIMALLEGELPLGLLPAESDLFLLAEASRQNPVFQDIAAAPLFSKETDGRYQLNREQRTCLLKHLKTAIVQTHQTLQEPYIVSLGIPLR